VKRFAHISIACGMKYFIVPRLSVKILFKREPFSLTLGGELAQKKSLQFQNMENFSPQRLMKSRFVRFSKTEKFTNLKTVKY
jgi:hypothetical protein